MTVIIGDKYTIVSKQFPEHARAVAWWKGPSDLKSLYPSKVESSGPTIAAANASLDAQLNQLESEALSILRSSLAARHNEYLKQQRVNFVGRGPRKKAGVRKAACIGWRHPVDSETMPECRGCNAIICLTCAACGCGSGVWIQPYTYQPENEALLLAFKEIVARQHLKK
jgi:hypothetical protein